MIRDEKTGKFVAESEQEKLERQIRELQARLEETKKAEAEKVLAEKKKAEEEKSLVRRTDAVAVQNLANAYLKEVEENKKIRTELAKKETEAYNAYQAKLAEFGKKHDGYHLTYVSKDGKTVEFKVEEVRANEFDRVRKEQAEFIKNFWNNFLDF